MKILITTDWYKPVVNGVVTSVDSLAKGLTMAGHEVRVLTLSGNVHSRKEGNVLIILEQIRTCSISNALNFGV